MNSNDKITRIKKLTGIAAKVIVVLEVLYIFAMICVCALICAINSGALQQNWDLSLTVAGKDLETMTGGALIFAIIAVTAKSILCLVAMDTVRHMLRDISQHETPFEQIHVKRMKRIAVLIFIASFVNVLTIQANEWLIAAVVWLLSMIFDYGCLLQQESDETL